MQAKLRRVAILRANSRMFWDVRHEYGGRRLFPGQFGELPRLISHSGGKQQHGARGLFRNSPDKGYGCGLRCDEQQVVIECSEFGNMGQEAMRVIQRIQRLMFRSQR